MWWCVIFGNFVYTVRQLLFEKNLCPRKRSRSKFYTHTIFATFCHPAKRNLAYFGDIFAAASAKCCTFTRTWTAEFLTDASCVASNWKFGSKAHTKFINELQRLLVNTDGYKTGLRHSTVHPLSLREEWTNYKILQANKVTQLLWRTGKPHSDDALPLYRRFPTSTTGKSIVCIIQ